MSSSRTHFVVAAQFKGNLLPHCRHKTCRLNSGARLTIKNLVVLSILLTAGVSASEDNWSDREDFLSFGTSIALSEAVAHCTSLYPESKKEFDTLLNTWELSNFQSIERGKKWLEQMSLESDFDVKKFAADELRKMGSLKNGSIEDQKLDCASVMEALIDGA